MCEREREERERERGEREREERESSKSYLSLILGTTYIDVEEPENSLVREDVEGVAGHAVHDGQSVHLGGDEGLDGLVQVGIRLDAHKRPLFVFQLLSPRLNLVIF